MADKNELYSDIPLWDAEVFSRVGNRTINTQFKTYITKNYGLFKKLQGNRLVNEKNVETIKNNIINNGLLPTVLVVNEKMEVIDGQHRLEAFKQLELPVMFQIYEGLGLEQCVAMNITGKRWELKDYVNSYAEQGSEDYKFLVELMELFPSIPLHALASIVGGLGAGLSSKDGMISQSKIRNGEFKLYLTKEESLTVLSYVEKFAMHEIRGKRGQILTTVGRLYYAKFKGIDYDKLVERFIKLQSKKDKVENDADAITLLQDYYNYRCGRSVRFADMYLNYYEKFVKSRK